MPAASGFTQSDAVVEAAGLAAGDDEHAGLGALDAGAAAAEDGGGACGWMFASLLDPRLVVRMFAG